MITEEIKQNIIKELGIENLSSEKAQEIMERLEKNIQRTVVLEILDLLSQQDQQSLNVIFESGDNAKVQSFLQEKVAGLDSLIAAVAKSVVAEFKIMSK